MVVRGSIFRTAIILCLKISLIFSETCERSLITEISKMKNQIEQQEILMKNQQDIIENFIQTGGAYLNVNLDIDHFYDASDVIAWDSFEESVTGSYDITTHTFRAPVSGTYFLSLMIMNKSTLTALMDVVKTDGTVLCKAMATGDALQNGICNKIMQLQKGEGVKSVIPSDVTEKQKFRAGYTMLSLRLVRLELS